MFRNPTADLLVVLVIVLLFLGPKRLPTLGRSLGQGMREFKDSITGDSKSDDAEEHPELSSGPRAPQAPAGEAEPAASSTAEPHPTEAAEPPSAEVGSDRS